MIMFGAIAEKIMVALFDGMNDHESAFIFLHYLSHFKTKFGNSNRMNSWNIFKCGLIRGITIGVL